MDLPAVKAATGPELAVCAIAAARNAQAVLCDAELLAGAGRTARAYSLSALAVEECGKAASLTALAMMPKRLRTRAPVGRMLQWHQLKQVGGLLLAVVPFDDVGPRLTAMPAAEMTEIICNLAAPAEEAERLKRRGFYVDMDRASRTREPSEITHDELASQLARAPQAVASASVLLNADAQTWILNPPPEARKLAAAMVEALIETGYARTPKAAAEVMLKAMTSLRDRTEAREASGTADPSPLQCGAGRRTKPESLQRRQRRHALRLADVSSDEHRLNRETRARDDPTYAGAECLTGTFAGSNV